MTVFRLFVAGILVLSVAAGTALAQHGNPYARAEVAKHKNGPWSQSSKGAKIATGHKKNVYVRISNTTSGPKHKLDVTLTEAGEGGPPEYHNNWFRGDHD